MIKKGLLPSWSRLGDELRVALRDEQWFELREALGNQLRKDLGDEPLLQVEAPLRDCLWHSSRKTLKNYWHGMLEAQQNGALIHLATADKVFVLQAPKGRIRDERSVPDEEKGLAREWANGEKIYYHKPPLPTLF